MRVSAKLLALLGGRLALVTDSMSGLGFGIAETLASRGCDVILHGPGDADVISAAKAKIESHGVESHWEDADLCDVTSVDKMLESIGRTFPKYPSILVNNADIQSIAGITHFSLETWQKMLTAHLTSPFHLIQRHLPHMVQQGWGRIINISSAYGLVASPYKAAFVSAKHGVIGLTKVVALEAAKTGVTCNVVCPGHVETPLFIKQAEERCHQQGITYDEAKRQIVACHATEEPIKVQQVAELVSFLCSPAADQMTGSSLVMDGGWTAK